MRVLVLLAAALAGAPAGAASAATLAALDALFAQRAQPPALAQLQAQLDAALGQAPDDFELLWRAARARHWQADGERDGGERRRLAKEAWALAERALVQAPQRAEGYYFSALGLGAYAQAVGVLKALSEGLEPRFNARLERALQLDPDLQAGGPLVAKGRYFYELPWPKRRLGKSAEYLRRALSLHPENLRARFYLAQTLLKDGERQEAKEALQQVLEGSVAYDPPEGERVKVWAREVQSQIEQEEEHK